MIEEQHAPLAVRVRTLRKCRHLTQAQLAERAGVSRNHVHRIEAGTRTHIGADILVRLARVLEVSVDELTGPAPLLQLPDAWLVDLGDRLEALPEDIRARLQRLITEFVDVIELPFVTYAATLNDLLGEAPALSADELQAVAEYALTLVHRQVQAAEAADDDGRAGGSQS